MPTTDNQGQNVDLLEIKKNSGESDKDAMTRWYKNVFLCQDFRTQQDFMKRFAEKNPGFLQMFEELRGSFIYNMDRRWSGFEEQRQSIRSEVSKSVTQILDAPTSRNNFFKHEQVKNFTPENWKYYGEVLLWWAGEKILANAQKFATSIDLASFSQLPTQQQLTKFVSFIGDDIYKLVDWGKNKSIHGKVYFLEAFLRQTLKDDTFSLTKVLSDGLPEKIEEMVDRARVLSDAVYIDAKDKKHYEWPKSPDSGPETPVELTKEFKNWRAVIVPGLLKSPQAKQASINSEADLLKMEHLAFKDLVKKVYPLIQVNFPLITNKDPQKQNETIFIEAFKVLKYQDEVERSERLARPENQQILSDYTPVLTEKNTLSGYYGVAFEAKNGDIVIASRGTGSLFLLNPDLANDAILAAKGIPPQKDDLQKLINRVAEKYGASLATRKVLIAWHSLWGALSELASTNVVKIPAQMKNITTFNFNGPGVLTSDRREERQNVTILNQDFIGDRGEHAGFIWSIETTKQGLFTPHYMENVSDGMAGEGGIIYINMGKVRESLKKRDTADLSV